MTVITEKNTNKNLKVVITLLVKLERFSAIFLTIKATYGQNSRGQTFTVFIATKVFYYSISRLQEAGNKIQNQGTQV